MNCRDERERKERERELRIITGAPFCFRERKCVDEREVSCAFNERERGERRKNKTKVRKEMSGFRVLERYREETDTVKV